MSTVDLDFYCDFNSDQLFDRLQKNNRVSTYKDFFFFFFTNQLLQNEIQFGKFWLKALKIEINTTKCR